MSIREEFLDTLSVLVSTPPSAGDEPPFAEGDGTPAQRSDTVASPRQRDHNCQRGCP